MLKVMGIKWNCQGVERLTQLVKFAVSFISSNIGLDIVDSPSSTGPVSKCKSIPVRVISDKMTGASVPAVT